MILDTPEKPEKPVYKPGWAKPKKKASPHGPPKGAGKGPAKGPAKAKRPAKSIESKFIDIGKPAARGKPAAPRPGAKPADGAARRLSERPGKPTTRSGPPRGPKR